MSMSMIDKQFIKHLVRLDDPDSSFFRAVVLLLTQDIL